MSPALVFGASGALGREVVAALRSAGHAVVGTSRQGGGALLAVRPPGELSALDGLPELDAVVWAQGANVNDTARDVNEHDFARVMDANLGFVVLTLARLLQSERIADGARLVMVSSVWEQVARPGKFSYTISKGALGALVRAAAADLAPRGIMVNAVLPGVTDTPMTRAMLGEEQIATVEAMTGAGTLVSPAEVGALVVHLCSPAAAGVTGQSIPVDLGFTHVRPI